MLHGARCYFMMPLATPARQWWYMPLLATATVVLLAKSYAYARLLGVSQFGVFSQYLLVGNSAALFCGLGMQWVAQKQWPRHVALHEADRVDASVLVALVIGVVISGLGYVVVAVAAATRIAQVQAAAFSLPAFALAQYTFTVGLACVRSEVDFVRVARLSVVRALLTASLGLGVAAIGGGLVAIILTESIATGFIGMCALGAVRLRRVANLQSRRQVFIRTAQLEMVPAVRLLLLSVISYGLFTLDRWVGLSTLSTADFGVYTAGAVVLLGFDSLQVIVNVSVQPLMARRLALGNIRQVVLFAHRCTALVVAVGVVSCAPLIWALNRLVLENLPGFEASLAVVAVLVPAGFLRLADFYGTLAILRDREIALATGAFTVCGLALASVALAIRMGIALTPARLSWFALALTGSAFMVRAIIACYPGAGRAA